MRKYHLNGVEYVHMIRHVPRSYDMTRTHIMHQGVNKHVDVVLRCSPKHWKKKVPVRLVEGEKKNAAVRIRVHADKGYVAVRKVINDKYESDRRRVVNAYETKYGAPSAKNAALIHDMKSQLASMAKRSADYIDSQLSDVKSVAKPEQTLPQQPKVEAPVPEFPKIPEKPVSSSMLTPETEEILKKGGYKRPNPSSPSNPYASDYLRQASDLEFRLIMESLEKSLDEACGKYAVDHPDDHPEPSDASAQGQSGGDSSNNSDFSSNITDSSDIYTDQKLEKPGSPDRTFSEGGEHYIPEDELFSRDFASSDESAGKPDSPQQETDFNVSRFFKDDEDEFIPPQTDSDGGDDFALPEVLRSGEEKEPSQSYSDYEHVGEADFNFRPDDGERGYIPPTIFPEEEDNFVPPTVFPDEEEDFVPPTVFPDEEEDFVPPTVFPDEEEDLPLPQYDGDDGGYSPAPVSPNINEYRSDSGYYGEAEVDDARKTETFFSRAGGQLKKVIGVIRGNVDGMNPKKNGHGSSNDDVEITYSDRSG